jgi:BMFP domain-containing protein YqiC
MSSSEQKFLVALRNKFESKKTRNIYAREQYNELLAKIKLLESSEKKSTTDYYIWKRMTFLILEAMKG